MGSSNKLDDVTQDFKLVPHVLFPPGKDPRLQCSTIISIEKRDSIENTTVARFTQRTYSFFVLLLR